MLRSRDRAGQWKWLANFGSGNLEYLTDLQVGAWYSETSTVFAPCLTSTAYGLGHEASPNTGVRVERWKTARRNLDLRTWTGVAFRSLMSIYVYKNGEQLGPYTKDQVTKALQAGDLNETDKAWASGVSDWTELKSLMSTAPVGCPQCRGQLILETEHPQRGTGIIVMVLGILLAPVCVGFILIFWGLFLTFETKSQWHCRSCGRLYPA